MNRRSFLALAAFPLLAPLLAACKSPGPAERFFSEGQARFLLPPNPSPAATQLFELHQDFRREADRYDMIARTILNQDFDRF